MANWKHEYHTLRETRVLDAIDEQLAVPGHNPSKVYLRPTDYKVFKRAVRRAEHFGTRSDLRGSHVGGVEVVELSKAKPAADDYVVSL